MADLPPMSFRGVSGWHRRPPAEPWCPPVPVHSLPLPGPLLYEAWHRFRRPKVERATGPVDVIWATGVAMPPHTAPIVLTLHDLAFRHDQASFTPHGLRFFDAALRRARNDADLVLCSSDATRADCVEAGFDLSRLRVVPLGVRPVDPGAMPDVEGRVAAVRRRFALSGRYLVFVGTVEPRKNLRRLLAAFRQVRSDGHEDLDLVIVGPEGWNEDLDAAVAPVADHVRRTGFLAETDKAALVRGATALTYPSLWEGFGLPILEAMALGVPVVTSAGIATEEVAGGAAVLVDPNDAGSIATGIARILDDQTLGDELRVAGLARAAEQTWDRTASLVAQALRDVAVAGTEPGSVPKAAR